MNEDPNVNAQSQKGNGKTVGKTVYKIPFASFDIDIPSELGDSNIGDDYLRREILFSLRQRLMLRSLIVKYAERYRKWRHIIGSILSLVAAAAVTRVIVIYPAESLTIGDSIGVFAMAMAGAYLLRPDPGTVQKQNREPVVSESKAPGDSTDSDRDDKQSWPGGDSGGKKE